MTDLDIQQQAIELSGNVEQHVNRLPAHDPVKPWFVVELEKIAVKEDAAQNSLEENNARIGALRQLYHLVFQHSVRKQNPMAENPSALDMASFLTVQARLPANVLDMARKLQFSIEPSLLHEDSHDNDQFDPVSPTAKVVSYLRSMDPSLSLFEESELNQQGSEILEQLGVDHKTKELMAVMFQSRYHAVNVAIQRNNSAQTIEFASGVSPRGLHWSQNSPGTIYVESDLPRLMVHKAKLVRNSLLGSGDRHRGLLHCCGVDVLSEKSINQVFKSVDPSHPVTLVTEGLLLYFSTDELDQFLTNIRGILVKHPETVWISDLVSRSDLESFLNCHPSVARAVKSVFELTGRSVVAQNPFADASNFTDYLTRFGLQIQFSVRLNSTLGALNFENDLSQKQVFEVVGERSVCTIKPIE